MVSGTWSQDGDRIEVAWFGEAGTPPRTALAAEVKRLASILDRDLQPTINLA